MEIGDEAEAAWQQINDNIMFSPFDTNREYDRQKHCIRQWYEQGHKAKAKAKARKSKAKAKKFAIKAKAEA